MATAVEPQVTRLSTGWPPRERPLRRRRLARALTALLLIAATVVTGLVVRRHEQIVNAEPLVQGGHYGGDGVPVDDLYGAGERLIAPGPAGSRAQQIELVRDPLDHPVTVLSADTGGALLPPVTVLLRAENPDPQGGVDHGPIVGYPFTVAAGHEVTLVLSFARPHCRAVASQAGGGSEGSAYVDSVRVKLRYRGETLTRQVPLSQRVVYPVGSTCAVPLSEQSR